MSWIGPATSRGFIPRRIRQFSQLRWLSVIRLSPATKGEVRRSLSLGRAPCANPLRPAALRAWSTTSSDTAGAYADQPTRHMAPRPCAMNSQLIMAAPMIMATEPIAASGTGKNSVAPSTQPSVAGKVMTSMKTASRAVSIRAISPWSRGLFATANSAFVARVCQTNCARALNGLAIGGTGGRPSACV